MLIKTMTTGETVPVPDPIRGTYLVSTNKAQ